MKSSSREIADRQRRIVELIDARSYLSVHDLSTRLGVSEVTIRRDLKLLERDERLQRKHGGAVTGMIPASAAGETPELADGTTEIAPRASEEAGTGSVVLLSAGALSESLARVFRGRSGLTVITNSMAIFNILRDTKDVHLVTTGGEYRSDRDALIGPLAENSISEIRADIFFMEPTGISDDFDLFGASLSEIPMLQAMLRCARETIVLAAPHAFGRDGVMKVGPITEANMVITSAGVDQRIITELNARGIAVVVA